MLCVSSHLCYFSSQFCNSNRSRKCVYNFCICRFNSYGFKSMVPFHLKPKFNKICQQEADNYPLKQIFNWFCFGLGPTKIISKNPIIVRLLAKLSCYIKPYKYKERWKVIHLQNMDFSEKGSQGTFNKKE